MFEPGPGGLVQIHDFNPGIESNGLFWTSSIPQRSVTVNPGSGSARMQVANLATQDYHDLINALTLGPFLPAVSSFDIAWMASGDRHRFHYEPETWDANVVFNTAQASWQAETEHASYVSDPASTSVSLFAEVGHERNGAFFS